MAVRYVTFLHPVKTETVRALLQVLHEQVFKHKNKDIYLLVSTPGGDVNEGILLFNTLRAMPMSLTTHNVGNVDSIGNVVFLAGSRRLANPNATFMWHGVGFDLASPTRLELKNVREMIGTIESAHARMSQSVAGCTSLTEEQINQLFLEASTKDASYALTHGIIHEIADVHVPDAAGLIHAPAAPT